MRFQFPLWEVFPRRHEFEPDFIGSSRTYRQNDSFRENHYWYLLDHVEKQASTPLERLLKLLPLEGPLGTHQFAPLSKAEVLFQLAQLRTESFGDIVLTNFSFRAQVNFHVHISGFTWAEFERNLSDFITNTISLPPGPRSFVDPSLEVCLNGYSYIPIDLPFSYMAVSTDIFKDFRAPLFHAVRNYQTDRIRTAVLSLLSPSLDLADIN